ncbi:RNA-directed DNA polymerase, eukaryota, reverse transcriptase zinc-binding domain protein [Tanacetum coccineum]|uniref:RNA-directed DNA polymerase, eukaryota, reverse transcriptase zinc-binding domain protein n=1 Tax=Tanacetum coccineum TaxID=301880 RepID=A0ABQ5I091_9ASTR
MDFKMATWNIRGMNTSERKKEVKKFFNEEKLHLCAVIETHIKYAKIKKVADFVYGNWEYVTNGENNKKGCRIMVGWDPNMIQVWMLGKEKQCMLFLVETLDKKMKFFYTIVYASNSGHERKRLWHSLGVHRQVVNGISWVIIKGILTVNLKCIMKLKMVALYLRLI